MRGTVTGYRSQQPAARSQRVLQTLPHPRAIPGLGIHARAAMAPTTTTNGDPTPPTVPGESETAAVDLNALKRKRDDTESAAAEENARSLLRVKHIQRDILHVLERCVSHDALHPRHD